MQAIIDELLTAPELTVEEVTELWGRFNQENTHLVQLVLKFEAAEEIYATYTAFRWSPTSVKEAVRDEIEQEFRKRGWYDAYLGFADACEMYYKGDMCSVDVALYLFDMTCRFLEHSTLDTIVAIKAASSLYSIILSTIGTGCDEYTQEEFEAYLANIDDTKGEILIQKVKTLLTQLEIPFDDFAGTLRPTMDGLFDRARFREELKDAIGISLLEHEDPPIPISVRLAGLFPPYTHHVLQIVKPFRYRTENMS